MEKLSRIVQQRELMTIGELEQQIACHSDESGSYKAVVEQLQRPEIYPQDKLRLCCLYILRFSDAKVHDLAKILLTVGLSHSEVDVFSPHY